MINSFNNNYISSPRAGSKDIWNASLLKGASYTLGNDIPICYKCTGTIPTELIAYEDARKIHKKLYSKDRNYHIAKYVHFYTDDQNFDGSRESVWLHPLKLVELLKHFDGVISVDFSTYADFPMPVKLVNIYRMRAMDVIFQNNGIPLIQGVRWGTEETWSYCFDGIAVNAIVSIGTVASGINRIINRQHFESGLIKMVELLNPHTIIIYGSANYSCFDSLRSKGIKIVSFPSKTNLAFKGRWQK